MAQVWGRERELELLQRRLDGALDGVPGLVVCSGEPGIGKTRLGEELAARAGARGVPVLWGRAAEEGGAPPYWPWRQVLASLREDDRAPGLPGVGDDAAEARFRFFDAVSSTIAATAAATGLVVVLDDMHGADRPSTLLLRHLVRELGFPRSASRRPGGTRLLLLLTRRDTEPGGPLDEVLPDLDREATTERLDLGGLGPAAVGGWIRGVVGRRVPDALVAEVHATTGGNPFFVGELARVIARDGEPGRSARARDAVAARVAALPDPTRELLTAAAVLGRRFRLDVVAALLDRTTAPALEDLDRALDRATAAGLVEADPDAGGTGRLCFVHALVRDAIDDGLPGADRVQWHRRAAGAVEAVHAGHLEPHLSEIARHRILAARTAEDRDRAADWTERAAVEAMRRLAYEEGARLYAIAGGLSGDAAERLRLAVALVAARHACADEAGAITACAEVAALARPAGRPDALGEAVLAVGCPRDPEADRRVLVWCEEVLDALPDAGRTGSGAVLRARLLALLAETRTFLDDAEGAEAASRESLALAERSGDETALVSALRIRQTVRSGPDGLVERVALTERLAGIRAGPGVRTEALLSRIENALEQGDLSGAGRELIELTTRATRAGGPVARWQLGRTRATLAQAHGRFEEARRVGEGAFATLGATSHPAAAAMLVALHGAIDHHVGPDPRALDALAAAAPDPDELAVGYRFFDVLGAAALLTDGGRHDDAGRYYRALGAPATWRTPSFFALAARCVAVAIAVAQGASDDVVVLRDFLVPFRAQHIAVPGAAANYGGPVALALGRAHAALGDLDGAMADLDLALAACERSGAAGYAVECATELARVLAHRGRVGDAARSAELTRIWLRRARALGMAPSTALLESLTPSAPALTAREREVASRVAGGATNAEIAGSLGISERTAQNHVQHVLAKLSFSRRSQIAAWVARADAARTPY